LSYLLDTNACIAMLRGMSPAVSERVRSLAPNDIHLCSVVVAELLVGAKKSRDPLRAAALVEQFAAPFRSLPFDDSAARRYAEVRAELESRGQRIGNNDLQIAAITLANELILVTHNTGEFGRIRDLRIEDWEAASASR
jgi:tRNA(fMet)-specific endonuclease VapC